MLCCATVLCCSTGVFGIKQIDGIDSLKCLSGQGQIGQSPPITNSDQSLWPRSALALLLGLRRCPIDLFPTNGSLRSIGTFYGTLKEKHCPRHRCECPIRPICFFPFTSPSSLPIVSDRLEHVKRVTWAPPLFPPPASFCSSAPSLMRPLRGETQRMLKGKERINEKLKKK